MGVGLYHLDRVAQNLNFPCKTIAIATNMARLRWSHAEDALLISDHGFKPATIREAQLMGRDRKSDILRLVSGLDVAFILTGLHGIAGKGVTSVVAETLGELDVFTIAITPGLRYFEFSRSLQRGSYDSKVLLDRTYPCSSCTNMPCHHVFTREVRIYRD
jgi:cell division GTPase FtsZ